MATHNADNERIKRRYFVFLKEAKRQSEDSVDAAAKALARFETATRYRDFKAFHFEQAVAFKRHLADQDSHATGGKLSKATLNAPLSLLKRFFQWLADKPGYKSRLQYSDAEYFNLSEKDTRVATAKRERPAPTLGQVKHTIALMPGRTDIELRNRALLAFALMTGARESALASMKLKHVDLANGSVFQGAREVQTKFSKSFTTYFFNVGSEVRQIFDAWVTHLRQDMLWATMTRCSQRRWLNWASRGNSRLRVWPGGTGARRHRSVRSSRKPSRRRGCRTSTLTVSGPRWSSLVRPFARALSSSRPGARTLDTRAC